MGMAVQTTYGFGFPKGTPGGLFDLSAHEIATRQAEGEGISFGVGVVTGSNKGIDVTIPTSAATTADFEGVVVHNSVMVEMDMDNRVRIGQENRWLSDSRKSMGKDWGGSVSQVQG